MSESGSDSSVYEEESETETPKKRIKGISHSATYKRNVIRNSKVAGKQHTNWKGKVVEARKTGVACSCKKKCFSRFSPEYLQDRLNYFNNFTNKNEQDIYLQGLITVTNVQRKRSRKNVDNKQKSCSFKYFLFVSNVRQEVCKKAFLAVHGITNGRLFRICKLLHAGKSPHDKRGENRSGNAVSAEVIAKIHEHIECYPTKISHYSGKERKYLDPRLNIKIMYEMFVQKCPELKVSYYFFLMYFRQNFSLSFGRPQVDTCTTCEELGLKIRSKVLNDNAKRTYSAELMVHKRRSRKFYNKIKSVKEMCIDRDDVVGLCFDYMANLPLPHIPVQDIFYYRQLWVYTFGIHDLKTNNAKMYMYHEGKARKSPNEVCTFLQDYIENSIPDQVKELYLFSDNCSGQNKNHTLLRFLSALSDSGRFRKIVYNLPIRGHSFLPCDRDFGMIKRIVRRADRVYIPEEFALMVKKSSKKQEKFEIKMVETEEITDYKTWWPANWKKTVTSVETANKKGGKQSFTISKFCQFEFDAERQGTIVARDYIDGMLLHTFRLRLSKKAVSLPSKSAYTGRIPINKKKLKDIQSVMKYIEEEFEEFYQDILEWPTKEREEDSEVEADNT